MTDKQKILQLIGADESARYSKLERNYSRNLITLREYLKGCGEIAAESDRLRAALVKH